MTATLTTLVNFTQANGAGPMSGPLGSLIADANGDLFGTAYDGGASGDGTVFELVNSGAGYTLSTLVNFNGVNGAEPVVGLIADASGDLFGTTNVGGASGDGTVFELVKSGAGYALSTLVSFNGYNGLNLQGSLLADASGDLFGTTLVGGTSNDGTVFELVKSGAGYTLSTLATFTGGNGQSPSGSLIADAHGDLFGTTQRGGANGDGTVFELVKGSTGYTLSTLVTFTGGNGSAPAAGLIADAKGDLFGTTGTVARATTARCSSSSRAARVIHFPRWLPSPAAMADTRSPA